MKILAALVAAALSAVAVMILMLAELVAMLADLVARLAPLVVLVAIGAIVWLVMRSQARPRPPGTGVPGVVPVAGPIPAAAAPIPAFVATESAGPSVPLPPKMPHYERFYLVRGDDAGLRSPRTDGYVKVAAPNLPAARPQPARRKPNMPRIERAYARRRPSNPRTRP